MSQSFFIPGPLPGLNEILNASNASRFVYGKLKKQWDKLISDCIAISSLRPVNEVTVSFKWVEKVRRRDPDNVCAGAKFVLDALVKSGILTGDGWREIKGLAHEFDVNKDNPGVLVTIHESNDN